MAPRKPKNLFGDLADATSAWLGGNRGTVLQQPLVTKAQETIKGVAQVVDSFTGGFGQAVVKDARSGSNTPSALYKTAAVNLAAGAVGAKAAQVAGRVLPKVARKVLPAEIGIHLSDVPNLSRIGYSAERAGTGLGRQVEVGQTYKFSPYSGTKTENFTASEFADVVAKENVNLASKSGMSPKNYGYVTKSSGGKIDPAYGPWSNARMVPSQRVVDRAVLSKSGNVEEVRNQIYSALVRTEQTSQRNARAVANTVGGAIGVGVQQAATQKGRRGGAKKR